MEQVGTATRRREWRATLASLAFLAAAVTLFFWDAIFTSQTFYLRDHLFTYRPYRAVVARMLQDGVLPLWNPYLYFGQPLQAVLIEVFYPTTLLHYVCSFETAFKAHILIHYYLAAFGMFALARALSLTRVPACAAALSYALGSFLVSDGGYFNSLTTAGWAPWVILSLVGAARAPRLSRIALAALPLGLAMIGGEAETLLFSVTVAFAIAVSEAEGPLLRRLLRPAVPFAAVGALGLLLAMIQVLPTAEMIALSPRAEGLGEQEWKHFSLTLLTSLEVLSPKILGNPAGDLYYLGASDWGTGGRAQYPYFLSIYVGVAALCLWGCGAILGRGRVPKVLGALAVVAFVLMYGERTPVSGWLLKVLPFMTAFRFPVKFFTLASIAGAPLAGYGVQALIDVPWREASVARRRVWGAALALVAGAVTVGGWTWAVGGGAIPHITEHAIQIGLLGPTSNREGIAEMLGRSVQAAGVTAALHLALLVAAAWTLSGSRPRAASFAVVLLLAVDFGRANLDLNRTVDPRVVEAVSPLMRALPPDAREWRVVSRLVELEYAQPAGVKVSNPDVTSILQYHLFDLLGLHPSGGISQGLSYGNLHDPGSLYPRVLRGLLVELKRRKNDTDWVTFYQRTGVKYVVSLEEIHDPRVKLLTQMTYFSNYPYRLYEVADPLPKAVLVPSARRVVSAWEEVTTWLLPSFDPRAEVLLEGAGPSGGVGGAMEQRVEVVQGKDPSVLVVRANAERDAWLLVTDSWWPGWKATVDGKPVEIEKADVLFRAVRVPAGPHEVRFAYEPWTFRVGAWASIAGLVLCGLMLLVPVLARRPVALPVAWIADPIEARAWPIALGLVTLWFHWALVSPSTCLFAGDHCFAYRPYRWVIEQIWGQGEVPLWNPYTMFGQPLLACPILTIYPTSLLYKVLPFESAYDMHFLFHGFVAAYGAYALGRRLGWAPWVSFVAAATWAFGGYMVSVEQFYNVVVTAAWAPAVIWAVDRVVERPTARRVAVAALFTALMVLGGEVQTMAFTLVVGGVVWLRHWPADRRMAWVGRTAAVGAAALALALALDAFQVLPTREMLARSPRAAGLPEAEREGFSMTRATAAEVFFPRVLGDPASDACYLGGALWGSPNFRVPPYLLSRYLGTVLLLLALFGGVAAKGVRPKVLAFLVVAGFLAMMGKNCPPVAAAIGWLPLSGLVRYPIKFFALVSLAEVVLVGDVLTSLTAVSWSQVASWRRGLALAGWIACACVLAAGVVLALGAGTWAPRIRDWLITQDAIKTSLGGTMEIADEVLRGGLAETGRQAVLGGLVLAAAILVVLRASWRRWTVPVLAMFVVLDLAEANRGVNQVAPVGALARRPPCLDLLPAGALEGRLHVASVQSLDLMPANLRMDSTDPHDIVIGHRFQESILGPYTGLRWGVRYGVPFDPGRVYPLEFSYAGDKWRTDRTPGHNVWFLQRTGQRFTFSINPIRDRYLTERGQANCLGNLPVRLYEVQGALPRAYIAAEEVAEPELTKAVDLWLSKGFDATRRIVVERDPAPARGGGGSASVDLDRSREVVVEADAPGGGTLVLLDSYDPGWTVEVDGLPAPVIRANALFRGVRLAPGHHTVRFYYDPASWRWGWRISVAALGVALLLLVLPRRARQAAPSPAIGTV